MYTPCSDGQRGAPPRWSPQGDFIVYVDTDAFAGYTDALRIVRPDGAGDRKLVTDAAYAAGLDSSSKGEFLIATAAHYGGLELIEVSTGMRIPLCSAKHLGQPSWRPLISP